jgi:uncharacterized protein YndB with AHSA1/START domain
VIEPIRLAFDVAAPPAHAFEVWTARIATWWPADHTMSGGPLQVVLEGWVGGRLLERTRDGTEHLWGEVLVWEPPSRLVYSWHLGRVPSDATRVEIRFVARAEGTTRVEIEHTGWERLGDEGRPWRDRNLGGWSTLLPHYQAAFEP